MNTRFVVGLTGGIGSGKTAVTDRFAAAGIAVIDADRAARLVVELGTPGLAAIAKHFGPGILDAAGWLNRAALRRLVFEDPAERAWLERLTHPLIGEEIARGLAAATSPYCVLSSPLLLETGQKDLADVLVVVDVPEELQLARTVARDGNDAELVRKIMAAQLTRAERLAGADIVIDNSGTLADLDERVAELHGEFLARAELAREG
ncbi:dephospho-CoA kinase [Pseudohaliea rubra]|uniref:Dephospho-CoA kinase n=1 Tax=Pseudohaliea rubra DSM 19751 TaxID=1265313 RepID=A0A095VW78_9GAMM|nr:dephospho-CoA kinase [Pseudohaliea rubra]KGE05318.1 Dephospho-CoA kinase [Pseudohaliea rubra DSM 19751]